MRVSRCRVLDSVASSEAPSRERVEEACPRNTREHYGSGDKIDNEGNRDGEKKDARPCHAGNSQAQAFDSAILVDGERSRFPERERERARSF